MSDPAEPAPLRRAIRRLESYDWVVFTGANGVARFWHELEAGGLAVHVVARRYTVARPLQAIIQDYANLKEVE
jgi:uroporphyrinogen-III synthase